MTDVVDAATRSRMMAGIKGKNTKPELFLRRALHAEGFRYRLHDTKLPGRPDIVLPKYNAVVMVNGCFWHGHDCLLFKWPSSNVDFWRNKIESNMVRDQKNILSLHTHGWRVATVWECSLRGRSASEQASVISKVADWIRLSAVDLILEKTND